MGRFLFKLPDVGEGIAEAEVVSWHVAVGSAVAEDDPLVDVMTDKATVEIPSPRAGRVLAITGGPGDKVRVGQSSWCSTSITMRRRYPRTRRPRRVLPLHLLRRRPFLHRQPQRVRCLQRKKRGALLRHRLGSPPLVRPGQSRSPPPPYGAVPMSLALRCNSFPEPDRPAASAMPTSTLTLLRGEALRSRPRDRRGVPAWRGSRRSRSSAFDAVIAERMQESKRRIPHYSYVEELDVTTLEELRAHLNARHGADRPRLTLLPFLIRALVCAIPRFPQVNALFDDETGIVRRHAALHIGIATQTPQGLMVPVVRHAEALDLWEVASEISRLAAATRDGTAARDELSGSTLTITSLGPIGGIVTTR